MKGYYKKRFGILKNVVPKRGDFSLIVGELAENQRKYMFLFFFLISFFSILLFWLNNLFRAQRINVLYFYSIGICIMFVARYMGSALHRKEMWYRRPYKYPSVDIVIPAYNEGESIYATIKKIVKTDYPKDRFRIIVANDGSKDDTDRFIRRAIKEFGKKNQILYLNYKKNVGKRTILARSIRKARGEMIVLVDSDSYLERKCLKEIVKPFYQNKKIGAVSAHTHVYNADKNILTKMQEVKYYNAFRTSKAVESLFGFVTCCPGCCSAYRRTVLLEILDTWSNQTFLGARCTYGEDRGLTNLVAKSGYATVYTQKAEAYTIVPENLKKYVAQQLRWKKSWAKENLVMCSFLFKRNIFNIFFVAFDRLVAPIMTTILISALIYKSIIYGNQFNLTVFLTFYLAISLCFGFYFSFHNQNKKGWILGSLLSNIMELILIFQLPYALLRARDTKWGTR